MEYTPRVNLTPKNGTLNATSGTINIGSHRAANFQPYLAGNSAYVVAVKVSESADATSSVNNCHAFVESKGVYNIQRGNTTTTYLAWRLYNGATAATGNTSDFYAVEYLD